MARSTPAEWTPDGLLEWRYLGGSWEVWRCRLCGATTDRHCNERINEYVVHRHPDDAERCLDRWHRMQSRRATRTP